MVRTIFILLITCVVLLVGGFIAKEKLGFDAVENFNIDKITGGVKEKKLGQDDDKQETNKPENDETDIYFLKVDNSENAKLALSTTKKEFKSDSERFRAAMETLFSGPNNLQKISGVYSEIPPETKLLGIKEDENSYTINISDDFEMGGGADSMKIRVKQLVTTATKAANGKDVYLEIEGKRVEYVGGEGIMILQPLQRNL